MVRGETIEDAKTVPRHVLSMLDWIVASFIKN